MKSLFVDENDQLKISDYWINDLFEKNIFTLANLDSLEDENMIKDKNFAISFLKKMLLGKESVKETQIYQNFPENLQTFIEKITENKINSLEDFMVGFFFKK